MNERIKELAKQAGAWEYYEINEGVDGDEKPMEKFAELIVRECLSVGEDVANSSGEGPWFEGYVSGVEEVNRRIKQHFGVEE